MPVLLHFDSAPIPIVSDEMLRNAGRGFHSIFCWRVAVLAYDVLDIISFPYMMLYVIHSNFSWRTCDIFIFQGGGVPCVCAFSRSWSLSWVSACCPRLRILRSWYHCNQVHRYSLIRRKDPVLTDRILLYDSVARPHAGNAVIPV